MESFGEEKAVSKDPRGRRAGIPGQHKDAGQQETGEGPPSRGSREARVCPRGRLERSDRGKKEEGGF
mgnify:CR=1 FL=1